MDVGIDTNVREVGRMLKAEDIKVKVEFTPGYEKRFTEACLRQLEKRERQKQGLDPPTAREEGQLVGSA